MSFMKLTDGQTNDTEMRDSLLRGAAILIAAYHKPNHQTIKSFAPKDKVTPWWTLDAALIASPIGCTIVPAYDAGIDYKTLDAKKLTVFGGYILGDFEKIDMPVIDVDDCATVLCDMISCSFLLAMKEQYAMAYAMQQASFQLMSLYTHKTLNRPNAAAFLPRIRAYGL